MNINIEFPYNATNIKFRNTGTGWAVSFDVHTAEPSEQAGAVPSAVTEFSHEAPKPEPENSSVAGDGSEREKLEEIRRKNRERQRAKRERDRDVTKRDSHVTKRDTSRDSVTGEYCLIEGLINYNQEDININQPNKQEQIYQRSTARNVTSRRDTVTERDTVTDQLYLNIDYPLPAGLDLPEIREAWKRWIKTRREEWGIYRISLEVVKEIFDLMESAMENGGSECVVAVINYNIENQRKNRWKRPVTEKPYKEPIYYTAPDQEPETEAEKAVVLDMMKETMALLKRGGRPA